MGVALLGSRTKLTWWLIGPAGVAVVEIKHWDRTRLKSEAWDVDHQADVVTLKAKRVASRLRKVQQDLGFVSAIFLLTKESKSFLNNSQLRHARGVNLYSLKDTDELVATVLGNSSLNPEKLARVLAPKESALKGGETRRIGRIGELKLLSLPSERFERIFSGRDPSSGDKVTLFLYDLSASNVSNGELIAKREFEAVQRLQKLSSLPSLVESFQPVPGYSGELYFFTLAESSAQTVSDAKADQAWGEAARLQFAASAMRALSEIQEFSQVGDEMVIHRSLSPQNVRVRADNHVLFAVWRRARIHRALSIAQFSTAESDNYAAPEVRTLGIGFADFRSDVYSLCSVLAELFTGSSELAEAAKYALRQGSLSDPKSRSTARSIAELLDSIEKQAAVIITLPAPQRWDEGHILEWEGGRYRILALLGEGGLAARLNLSS